MRAVLLGEGPDRGRLRETRGFWVAAQAEPDRRALVEADGRAITMGELLAACNRVVHGLRAQGLEHGDCIATLLPNGAPAVEVLLAAMQAGWYITPINTNLAAPEIAYILTDSGARALVGHAAYADKCIQAADGAGLPAQGHQARPGSHRSRHDGAPDRVAPGALRHHAERRPRTPVHIAHVSHGAARLQLPSP